MDREILPRRIKERVEDFLKRFDPDMYIVFLSIEENKYLSCIDIVAGVQYNHGFYEAGISNIMCSTNKDWVRAVAEMLADTYHLGLV